MALVVLFSVTTGNNKNKFERLIWGLQNIVGWPNGCKMFLLILMRIICRIGFLGSVFIVYFLQLIALVLQKKYWLQGFWRLALGLCYVLWVLKFL